MMKVTNIKTLYLDGNEVKEMLILWLADRNIDIATLVKTYPIQVSFSEGGELAVKIGAEVSA